MNNTAELTSGQPLILDLLMRKGIVAPEKLDILREVQGDDDEILERVIITNQLGTENDIVEAYAEYLGIPVFDPEDAETALDPKLAHLLPEKLCRDQLIVPLEDDDEMLDVAFATPNEMVIVDELQLLTGRMIRPFIARLSLVEGLIDALYSSDVYGNDLIGGGEEFQSTDEEYSEGARDAHEDQVLHVDRAPPSGRDGRIIRLVNQTLEQALRVGASDIHLEPFEDCCKIRLRVDGVLHEMTPPPKALFIPMVSRYKILAKMDIAEKRVPQDGAIAVQCGEKRVDLRVNSVPTVHGEKIVMRILDQGAIPLELTGLGLDERQANDLIESIQSPHGLMLVTGPTGSGKSTTLYACLNYLNKPDTNICTVEDPVEYRFKGINQIHVKPQVALTFASALRAFLRQDPDVIMVGEVRDQETAQICLRAALTGHFVLSTIHTNDSLSSISRLQDMGIEPFLLAATLRVLEAQRLIRRLCNECKAPYECNPETAERHGLQAGETLHAPNGCGKCRNTGYRGRVGIFEVVRITNQLSNLIQSSAPLPDLRAATRDEGMKLLADSALAKVRDGLTSLEEALGVTMSAEE